MELITRMLLYDATYLLGFTLMIVISLSRCRVYRISKLRAVIYCFITFLSGLLGAWLIGQIFNRIAALKDWIPGIKVDMIGAVIFTAPLVLAAVYIEKGIVKRIAAQRAKKGNVKPVWPVSFRDTLDLMITGAFFVFASIKLGCAIRGCCWGVECGWGVETPYLPYVKVFPIQICECLTLIAIVLLVYAIKRTRFFRRGMGGPLSAFFYGAARFLWEFLRWYQTEEIRHFFLGLTLWQILCLLILLVTMIWIAVLYKTQPSEPQPKAAGSGKLREWLPSFKKPEKKPIVHSKKKKGRK